MMDDLDIEYRIAKIDGVQCQIEQADTTHAYLYSEDLNSEYHPLTDDALCFRLMIKYRIDFSTLEDSGKYYVSWALGGNLIEESPNKAICLAIIELYKGK